MRKIIYLVLVLLIGLFSCENDNSNEVIKEGYRPVKIIEVTDEGTDTIYFSYDGDNPILIESNSQISEFEYQDNYFYKRKYFRKGDNIAWLYNLFEYDSEFRMIRFKYYINVNSTVEGWTGEQIDSYELSAHYGYVYDDEVITNEFYYDDRTRDTSNYKFIEYDVYNNIISKTEYESIQGQRVKNEVLRYTYDNKNHHLKDINYPTYGRIYSTENNILKEEKISYNVIWDSENGITITDSTVTTKTISYEYNEFGYPKKVVDEEETLFVEYEYFTTTINE